MAKEVVIEFKSKGVNNVADDAEKVDESIQGITESADEANESIEGMGDGFKKAGKDAQSGLGNMSKGFDAVGTAIKGAGIGLVIGLFATLKEVLEDQQTVLDAFDTAMNAIGLVVNEVVGALTEAFETTSEATGGFDAMKEVVMSLLTIAITPLKLTFFEIKAAVLAAQLAWEQSFFGDGDETRIAELKEGLSEVKDDLIDTGKAALEAGQNIGENIGEAINEVATFAENATEKLKEVNTEAIAIEAQRITALKNRAAIAEAVNKRLFEQFDQEAEQLRQIRDNVRLTFEERRAASEQLKVVLEEQNKAQLAQANAVLASARAEDQLANTTESRVALEEALAEVAAINADIEGRRSEQKEQDVALTIEQVEATNAQIDAETELTTVVLESEEEKIAIVVEANRRKVESYEAANLEETQGYKDAVLALQLSELEKTKIVEEAEAERRMKLEEQRIADELADAERKIIEAENEEAEFQARRELLMMREQQILADEELSESQRNLALAKNSEQRMKIDEAELKFKQAIEKAKVESAFATANSLVSIGNSLNQLAGESAGLSKAITVTQIAIDTARGISGAIAAGSSIPFPGNIPAIASGVAAVLGGIVSAKNALSKAKSIPGAPEVALPNLGSGAGGASVAAPPVDQGVQFAAQELAPAEVEEIGTGAGTNQVVVLESDITDTQNKVETVESTASFGG